MYHSQYQSSRGLAEGSCLPCMVIVEPAKAQICALGILPKPRAIPLSPQEMGVEGI